MYLRAFLVRCFVPRMFLTPHSRTLKRIQTLFTTVALWLICAVMRASAYIPADAVQRTREIVALAGAVNACKQYA